MSTVLSLDNSRRMDIKVRRGQTIDKTILVKNASDASDFDFTGWAATLSVYSGVTDQSADLVFSDGAGLELSEGEITLTKTSAQMSKYRRHDFIYFLWMTSPSGARKLWLNGLFIVHEGLYDDDTDPSQILISLSGDGVTLSISGGEAVTVTDEIPLEAFDTELTFDEDKDLETISGGTTTFTLAADGHLNGVGIVARINAPVAVNFPAGFEAVEGSSAISTTEMNIIIFRYFEDYDGAGNDKVLYCIKNQTSV